MWACVCGQRLTVDARDVEVLDAKTQGVWHVEVGCRCGRRVRITKAAIIVLKEPPRKTIIRKRGT